MIIAGKRGFRRGNDREMAPSKMQTNKRMGDRRVGNVIDKGRNQGIVSDYEVKKGTAAFVFRFRFF